MPSSSRNTTPQVGPGIRERALRGSAPFAFALALGLMLIAGSSAVVSAADRSASSPAVEQTVTLMRATFDAASAQWSAQGGQPKIGLTTAARQGSHALTLTTTPGMTATLHDRPTAVGTTVAGTTYSASVWVRADRPTLVGIFRLGSQVGDEGTTSFSLADALWHQETVSFRATTNGGSLELSLATRSETLHQMLLVDYLTLVARRDALLHRAHPWAEGGQLGTGAPTPSSSASPTPTDSSSPTPTASPDPTPTATLTATPPSGGTQFGADVYVAPGQTFDSALAAEDSTFGHLNAVRIYIPGVPHSWPLASDPTRTVIESFKVLPQTILTGQDDAALAAWFRSAPTGHPIYWSYWHEPENDIAAGSFTPAEYRAAWQHIAAIAAQAQNPSLVPTLILMAYTLNPISHRSFDDYYPGSSVISVLGWDAYNQQASSGQYEPAATIFGRVVALSQSLGKPWGIAETGSLLIAGDDGSGRAAWLDSVGSYLSAAGASWVTYFNAPVGGQFQLQDPLSQQAWRSVVTGQPGDMADLRTGG